MLNQEGLFNFEKERKKRKSAGRKEQIIELITIAAHWELGAQIQDQVGI